MFAVSGTGLAVIKTWQNEGKRPRYSVDQWDRVRWLSRVLISITDANCRHSKV